MAGDSKIRIEHVGTGRTPTKAAWKSIANVPDAKEVEQIVCKAVLMAAKWTGKMENGKDKTLEEDFVVMTFGDVFVQELKITPGGWVDVPIGDYKPSHFPSLKVIGAPEVNFNRSDGEDLCVSKPLASALYRMDLPKWQSKLTCSEKKS